MISALFVNYFTHQLISRAVKSVLADDPTAEIIVVDNSEDMTEHTGLASILPGNVKLIRAEKNLGFGNACNLAFKNSQGDFVLLLNPDAVILPGFIKGAVECMQQNPDFGGITPKTYWDNSKTFVLPPGQMPTPLWELLISIGFRLPVWGKHFSNRFKSDSITTLYGDSLSNQEMLSGSTAFFRRNAILSLDHFFRPEFFMYYEDTDLSIRLLRKGWKLGLNPAIEAIHEWENNPSKAVYSGSSRDLFMKLNFPRIDKVLGGLRGWIERQIQSKTIYHYDNLGSLAHSPKFYLAPEDGPYIIEVSPHPLFIPAAYFQYAGALEEFSVFSPNIWRLMFKGDYFIRITNKKAEQNLYRFSMLSSPVSLSDN
ncbi:glycosyltransferase family 2 protein [Nitrosomonas sp. sh817]|uniref:glycosyltransferase family 2 protein n=1 Tax=Nitrosomonas sp. sh817 TaxID=3070658 RepID=UPI0027DE23C2|nr:glycosyltransferase family 2 protein [Nitrosomonas sp. sh817]WMJ09069.1 glycosyltransferase family 2 protein [Nitrosomonas sp. sh817]